MADWIVLAKCTSAPLVRNQLWEADVNLAEYLWLLCSIPC